MTTETIRTIPILDRIAQGLAKALGMRSAGLFWISGGTAFVDAWGEPGAWTLRMGRIELQVDLPAVAPESV